jgi:flagellar biosynthesis regulator FlaF
MVEWFQHVDGLIGFAGGIGSTLIALRRSKREDDEAEANIEQQTKEFIAEQAEMANQHLLQAMELTRTDNAALREQLKRIQADMNQLEKELRAEIVTLTAQHRREYELRVKSQLQMTIYMQAHMSLPLPMWVKDKAGRMVSVNEAFAIAFLHPRGKQAHEYSGKTDSEFWGPDIGANFEKNDRTARAIGYWEGVESEAFSRWRSVKYRLIDDNGDFAGYGGAALPESADMLYEYGILK